MRNLVALTCLFLLQIGLLWSQKIEGTVYENIQGNQEPVAFVNVSIQGTTVGTTSDFDGKFSLKVPPGKHHIDFRFIGYKSILTEYTFTEGQTINVSQMMESDIEELNVVMVEAKQNLENESVLLMEQKNSDVISQSIGANELARKGVSDVATGLTKVSGISVSNGNAQMYIRGLGDRYNSAMLNGLPIASPNPELKVIPMDIFPTEIVENVGVSKVFLTDRYADYAGALIDIKTKDYPEQSYIKVGVKGEYNTQVTGKDFKSANGGTKDFWGFDDGSRAIPSQIATADNFRPEPEQLSADPFGTTFGFQQNKAPKNIGMSLQGGRTFKLNQSKLGVLASASFDNDHNIYEGVYRVLNSQYEARTDYEYTSYVYGTNLSAMTNFTYQISNKHSIRLVTLFVNDSENGLAEYYGYNRDQGNNFFTRRSTYREHSLFTNQLIGDHQVSDRIDVEWASSYEIAKSEEPDRKQLVWIETAPEVFSYNSIDRANNNRFYSAINENELNGRAAVTYKLKKFDSNGSKGKFKMGGDVRFKNREFNARQFNYDLDPGVFNGVPVDPQNPTKEISDNNIANNSINIIEQISPSNTYNAYLNIIAFYSNLDLPLSPSTTLGFGLRYEYSDQTIEYKKVGDLFYGSTRIATLEENNIFPNLNVRYKLTEKSNLRAALSKTLSRPEFKETAPFLYEEIFGGAQIQGNDSLKNAFNYNIDLKYELFARTGEMMAVSVFGRYLENPIERVVISSSSQLYSFQNAHEAYVGGVEVEYNKKLSNVFKEMAFWKDLSCGVNFSVLYSQINLEQTNSTINTNTSRGLQGASPYLVNADLNYELKHGKTSSTMFTLTYNVFGPRLYSVGTLGAGDIYERPVNTIDFLVRSMINKRLGINLSIKNLLNQEVLKEQDTDAEPIVVKSKKDGTRIGLSLTYSL